jgi:hypothetical protein
MVLPAGLWVGGSEFLRLLFGKDVMTATNTLSKTQTLEQATEPIEGNIGVRSAA